MIKVGDDNIDNNCFQKALPKYSERIVLLELLFMSYLMAQTVFKKFTCPETSALLVGIVCQFLGYGSASTTYSISKRSEDMALCTNSGFENTRDLNRLFTLLCTFHQRERLDVL